MNTQAFKSFRSFAGLAALFAAMCLLSCQDQSLETADLEINRNLPTEVPEAFLVPNATVRINGAFQASSFLASPESATVLETDLPAAEVIAFYNRAFAKERWHVIQSLDRGGEYLLMAESEYRKLVTVIVRSSAQTQVKIYSRRSSDT